LYIIYISSNLL